MQDVRVLIVGNPETIHVGAHFRAAAETLGAAVELCDIRRAFDAPWALRQFNWRLRSHRPPRLDAFGADLLKTAKKFQPALVLVTGIAPVTRDTIEALHAQHARVVNFLTDDPWNPAHHAPWFLRTLAAYDAIYSPRRANLTDLKNAGCRGVEYLPFAYNPHIHFRDETNAIGSDVLFAGGADADRVPYMQALVGAGLDLRLYGGYWERHAYTRPFAHGHADMATLRHAVNGARVCLGLVRRANRDGHVMRTFELPAMGGCLLLEDTSDHREIFGADGDAAIYFQTKEEMVTRARWLIAQGAERARLAQAAHARITQGTHTYADRLRDIFRHTPP